MKRKKLTRMYLMCRNLLVQGGLKQAMLGCGRAWFSYSSSFYETNRQSLCNEVNQLSLISGKEVLDEYELKFVFQDPGSRLLRSASFQHHITVCPSFLIATPVDLVIGKLYTTDHRFGFDNSIHT